jgi:hypothetical protein
LVVLFVVANAFQPTFIGNFELFLFSAEKITLLKGLVRPEALAPKNVTRTVLQTQHDGRSIAESGASNLWKNCQ